MTKIAIAPGVTIEQVGEDLLVLVPGTVEALRLTGVAANTVRTIHAGGVVAVDDIPAELVERGIITTPQPLSRRGLIKAGAIGAGAGITVLAMPGVAAASSTVTIRYNGVYYWDGNVVQFAISPAINDDYPTDPDLLEPFFPSQLPPPDETSQLTLTPTVEGLGTTSFGDAYYAPDGSEFNDSVSWNASLAGGEGDLPLGPLEGFFLWDGETIYVRFTLVDDPSDN
jgi:hypothetical protein